MQILRENKKLVLIVILLVAILIASLIIVQIVSKPSQAPPPSLYPGEVTQYQGQNLTSIIDFLGDINQHPDVAIDGTQYINQTTYRLSVTGLVSNTSEYTYDELINNFQSVQQVGTLLCVEGWSITMLWQGIPIQDFLQEAGASPNATTLIFYASDGYTTELPINYVVQNNLILAYKVNNVTLPAAAGFPLMLVAQNQYGYKWIKWVTRIDVSNDSSYLGYWESRGYPNNATVNGNPSNSTTLWEKIPVAEVIAASIVGIAIIAVVYTALRKRKNQQMRSSSSHR